MNLRPLLLLLISLLPFLISGSVIFHAETRSTRLVNRTLFGSSTECSVRLGGRQFALKFYRMITCRYVENLSTIYPYLLKYSNDITALEIVDSTIKNFNLKPYAKVFAKFEFLIFHRTTIQTKTSCPFNVLSKTLLYLHLAQFSPNLDKLFINTSCSVMKRLHVLILDHTNVGNEKVLLSKLPHLHVLRLNFSMLHQPLNYSYMRSFSYLQDLLLTVNDDCHRCEYEWLKYAARDDKYLLFHLSSNSGCMDWNRGGKFVKWQYAPLCGSCSLPLLSNRMRTGQICKMEDGITEHYCKAFYGRQSIFQSWTDVFDNRTRQAVHYPSTSRPPEQFMKWKYTTTIGVRRKRQMNTTLRTTTTPILRINASNNISAPAVTNLTTFPTLTTLPWQSRHVVTRRPTDLFNRSYCSPISNSSHRPKIRSNLPSLIDQLFNISQRYAPNCSRIQCQIIQSDYLGPVCLKAGFTYASICEMLIALCTQQLDVHDLQIDYFGPCVNNCSAVSRCFFDRDICVMTPKPHCTPRRRNCTGFAPVCDTTGKTFVNQCHLSNSLMFNQPRQLAYRGPCQLNRQCQKKLCQSNETCVRTQDKYHYPVCLNCQSDQRRTTSCPFELFCGDNKRQYINRCQLHYERCQTKTFIRIEHFGLCPTHADDDDR